MFDMFHQTTTLLQFFQTVFYYYLNPLIFESNLLYCKRGLQRFNHNSHFNITHGGSTIEFLIKLMKVYVGNSFICRMFLTMTVLYPLFKTGLFYILPVVLAPV